MIRISLVLFSFLLSSTLFAAELTEVGRQVGDKAAKQVQQTENLQLLKAKAAAQQTEAREQAILQNQPSSPWQAQQRAKAQQQFDERKQREAKYLQQAKDAAAKEQKMEKPKMKIIKRKTE